MLIGLTLPSISIDWARSIVAATAESTREAPGGGGVVDSPSDADGQGERADEQTDEGERCCLCFAGCCASCCLKPAGTGEADELVGGEADWVRSGSCSCSWMSAAAKAAAAAATEVRLVSAFFSLAAEPAPRSLRLLPPPTLPAMLPFLRAPTTVPEGRVTSPPGSLRVDDGFSADGQTHSRPALRQRLQSGLLRGG